MYSPVLKLALMEAELMLMILQRHVFMLARLHLGPTHKIIHELVYLDAQNIHLDKILQDSAFQIVLYGEHLLITRQHSV